MKFSDTQSQSQASDLIIPDFFDKQMDSSEVKDMHNQPFESNQRSVEQKRSF